MQIPDTVVLIGVGVFVAFLLIRQQNRVYEYKCTACDYVSDVHVDFTENLNYCQKCGDEIIKSNQSNWDDIKEAVSLRW